MKKLAVIWGLLSALTLNAQSQQKNILFIGNSYTAVNNLPQMLTDVAMSTGDTLYCNSNCPGGYTFELHSTNATTLSYIANGNWDYVVLQEQSQLPSFPISQVEADVFPYAMFLDSLINAQNTCVETVFYMTWGRKNGDASNCAFWPPVCTYQGMDSLLSLRYQMMADSNSAILSPVGAVWKYIRNNHPGIELYNPDESHPSLAGTYAAACSFYSVILRKDPTSINFDAGLSSTDAAIIRNAAKMVVFDSLSQWHVGEYDPMAQFSFVQTGPNQIQFTNESVNADSYQWNFGDGNNSFLTHPTYTYAGNGNYDVTLYASGCGLTDSIVININLSSSSIEQTTDLIRIYPNPSTDYILIESETENHDVRITNLDGRMVDQFRIQSTKAYYDLSEYKPGIYFVSVYDEQRPVMITKLIVQ